MTEQTKKQTSCSWGLLTVLWLCLAVPETVLHLATAKSTELALNSGLLLGPVFALLPAAVVWLLCTAMDKRWKNFLLALVYGSLSYLLCASQLVYFRVFGTFYTFYSMTNGTGAFQFIHTILAALKDNWVTLALMALPLVVLVLLCLKKRYFTLEAWGWRKVAVMALALAVQFGAVQALPLLGGTGDISAYGLYHNTADAYLGVNRLGLLTAFRLDVVRTVTGTSGGGSISLGTTPTVPETTVQTQTEPTVAETTMPTDPPVEYNVLEIDFDALIAGEDSTKIQEVHQYFAARTPSEKNDKTGLFEGSNLILITAEAFSNLIVDPERTPTLYKMMHEGYYFTDYYVPDWGVSTTDGEYAHLTGTIPKEGVWSFKRSSENYMPLTMNQQLMKLGYSSYAYHGHTYSYYDRDLYLTNLGYEYKGRGNGLDVKKQWPASDVEVVEKSVDDFLTDTPFSVYYMTISGHREFNFLGNNMAAKHKADVADEPYSEAVRAYLACQLELELSLQLLEQKLQEAGVWEDTVIVLTADHYPNGLTTEEIGELLGHEPEGNFEIYQNGCIIYKPGMEPETITEPTSALDILPTLSNLFGLEFDSRLYMGRDVFSDAEPLVIFRNRSWITDRARYNSQTGKVEFFDGTESDDAYVEAIKNEVSNRFAVSTRILENDYWAILFEK